MAEKIASGAAAFTVRLRFTSLARKSDGNELEARSLRRNGEVDNPSCSTFMNLTAAIKVFNTIAIYKSFLGTRKIKSKFNFFTLRDQSSQIFIPLNMRRKKNGNILCNNKFFIIFGIRRQHQNC